MSSYRAELMSWYSSTNIQRKPASSCSLLSSASSGGNPSPCNNATACRNTSSKSPSRRRFARPAKLAPTSRIASAWQVSTITPAGVVPDEVGKATAYLDGGMPVEGQS